MKYRALMTQWGCTLPVLLPLLAGLATNGCKVRSSNHSLRSDGASTAAQSIDPESLESKPALKMTNDPVITPNGAECSAAGLATANAIVKENCLPGVSAAVWDVDRTVLLDAPTILENGVYIGRQVVDHGDNGFTTKFSYNAGEAVDFKLLAAGPYSVNIYRLGYYQGHGASLKYTVNVGAADYQPACVTDSARMTDCSNWHTNLVWNSPATALSGFYIARLDVQGSAPAIIPFVIRNDGRQADVAVQAADASWQAYNRFGGCATYECSYDNRLTAPVVSFQRPYRSDPWDPSRSWHYNFFSNQYPLMRFLERNGYDVAYIASRDSAYKPGILSKFKTIISVGHDEYWSREMRVAFRDARDSGKNLMFLGGNSMFEQCRFDPDEQGQPNRLVSYKDSRGLGGFPRDPGLGGDPWTNPDPTRYWRDPGYINKATYRIPENELMGLIYTVGLAWSPLRVTGTFSHLRQWANTPVANLGLTETYTSPNGHLLSYELDEDLDNGYRPAGLFHLTSTHQHYWPIYVDLNQWAGISDYDSSQMNHHFAMYREQKNRALVMAVGTIQFPMALDAQHDDDALMLTGAPIIPTPVDPAVQQLVVNVLADMKAQPTHLQPGLVAAQASADQTPPHSSFTALSADDAPVSAAKEIELQGTSADSTGQVAGVEVSTDGGSTWHPADGTSSWSYHWRPIQLGLVNLKVRAVDDSGNLEAPVTRRVRVVGASSLFAELIPVTTTSPAPSAGRELGIRFVTDVAGTISAINVYKGHTDAATYVVQLWGPAGENLATATGSAGAAATGWQRIPLSAPVAILPGKTYTASHFTKGVYSVSLGNLSAAKHTHSPPLRELGSAYTDGASSAFPSSVADGENYWVDFQFTPTANTKTEISFFKNAPVSAAAAYVPSTTPVMENGTKFRAEVDGYITSIRYYRHASDTGHHIGNLWFDARDNDSGDTVDSATGQATAFRVGRLSFGRFSEPAAVGWQEMRLPLPVPVAAGTILRASVGTKTGHLQQASYTPAPDMGAGALTYLSGCSSEGSSVPFDETDNNNFVDVTFVPAPAQRNTFWTPDTEPVNASYPGTGTGYELSTKFVSEIDGYITGIRFYRGAGAGVQTSVRLWFLGNTTPLTTAYIVSQTGWNEAKFDQPVRIVAKTVYQASYYAPDSFALNANYFANPFGVARGSLRATGTKAYPYYSLLPAVDSLVPEPAGRNGGVGTPGAYPGENAYHNYWVEPVFVSTLPANGAAIAPSCVAKVAGATCTDALGASGRCSEASECLVCNSWCRPSQQCESGSFVCPAGDGMPVCQVASKPDGNYCRQPSGNVGLCQAGVCPDPGSGGTGGSSGTGGDTGGGTGGSTGGATAGGTDGSTGGTTGGTGGSTNLTINTTIDALNALQPGCRGPLDRNVTFFCRAAVRRLCVQQGFSGGMLTEYDSVNAAQVVCLQGQLLNTTVAALTGIQSLCSGRYGPTSLLACDSAGTVACGAGYVGAFLQEYDGPGNAAAVVCVSTAAAVGVTVAIPTLTQFLPYCAGPWNLDSSPISCNAAYSRYCRSLNAGYQAGFIVSYDSVSSSTGACVK